MARGRRRSLTLTEQAELTAIVEMQRVELQRLMRENTRLNERLSKMFDMQEREQVLRQQLQGALAALTERKAELMIAGAMAERSGDADPRLAEQERRFRELKHAVGLLVQAIERERAAADHRGGETQRDPDAGQARRGAAGSG